MIIGFTSAFLDKNTVYTRDSQDQWIIEEPIVYKGRIWVLRMRKIDLETYEPTDTIREFGTDDFLDGSGFGGGPLFRPDWWLKVQNGAIYSNYNFT